MKYGNRVYQEFIKRDTLEMRNISFIIIAPMLGYKKGCKKFTDIENLQKAINDKNSDHIVKFSHYIKGACSSLAMNEASLILENIEKKALKGEVDFNLDDLKSILKDIQDSL